ncbi:hypothetical protein BJV74DRAFT_127189 [Russula compacta]|nr:hypothetical protein BJV74DRAFT_127189 [Russula compacta]
MTGTVQSPTNKIKGDSAPCSPCFHRKMMVFAIANNTNSGGYYIASDRDAMEWRELPHDLADEMEDVRKQGEEVEEVSIGLDGDWFLRTNARHACKTQYSQNDMVSNVEKFAHLIQEAGLSLEDYGVQFFTFVPDTSGYITVLHKTDGSLTRCAWHNVPPELDILLEREASKGVRHVAVGMNGSYVVVLNTGVMWWGGVPDPLNRLLDDAKKSGRGVATVSLSLISDSWYFIEFKDGATRFCLPPDWHESINKYTARAMGFRRPKMSTSYNPAPPPSYRPPHHAQVGSFNPYLSSVFISAPPPPPVYNIAHVYNNTVPQQLQRSSSLHKYDGTFKYSVAHSNSRAQ